MPAAAATRPLLETAPERLAAAESREPVAVMLFNLGGPADQASVEPFLINLFSDRDIIELPLGALTQPLFARLVAKLRGPSVRRNYALIGGGSPQLRITRAQARALEERLNRPSPKGRGASYRVVIAMRYWDPTTEHALEEIRALGIRRIVTLTLFPHWSKATTGSSQKELERALRRDPWKDLRFEISGVDRYAQDPLYLDAFAETILRAYARFSPEARERAVILFSAHGLPQKFIDEGDPYVEQIEATRAGLLDRLRLPNRQVLGYQSRTGPVKWIGPGTDERIAELGAQGVKSLLVVPLSFVSDHIETLYEVDILFADMARKAGITEYVRPDALNTHPGFIEALARLVETHMGAG